MKCNEPRSFSELKTRSAKTPTMAGIINAAKPMVEKTAPICKPVNPIMERYFPAEINHVPHIKNWRKLSTESFLFKSIAIGCRFKNNEYLRKKSLTLELSTDLIEIQTPARMEIAKFAKKCNDPFDFHTRS
jgi:hypothetical protein